MNEDKKQNDQIDISKINSFLQKPFSMAKVNNVIEKIRMHNDYVFV
jgi:hypothetical protein